MGALVKPNFFARHQTRMMDFNYDDPRALECYEDVSLMDLTCPLTPIPFVPFTKSSASPFDESDYLEMVATSQKEQLSQYSAELKDDVHYEPTKIERGLLIDLNRQIAAGNNIRKALEGKCKSDPFELVSVPTITLPDFTQRIFEYGEFEESAWVIAYVLLERYKTHQWNNAVTAMNAKKKECPCYWIDSLNSHRLLAVSLLTAIKLNEDNMYPNKFFANIFGISLRDLNLIEIFFCRTLNWNLHVDEHVYQKYEKTLLFAE